MPNVALNALNPYQAQQEDILRRRKMAELLQQQSMQPVEQRQVNGITAANSPLEYLAKALQGVSGAYDQRALTEESKKNAIDYTSGGQRALAEGLQKLQGATAKPMVDEAGIPYGGTDVPVASPAIAPDKQAAMTAFEGHPMTQPYAQAMLAQMLKSEDPYTLAEGAKRIGPGGKILAENPKAQPGFSLSPGGVRFGPDGKQIAALPEKVDYNKPFLANGQPNPAYQAYELEKASRGGTRVNVSNDMRAENAYASGAGSAAIKRDNAQHEAAVTAPVHIAKLDETLKELKSGKALTGMGSALLKELERAKVLIAQDKAAGKVVSDTEYLDSLLGSDVFPLIQQLGIGARGMDTPAEREFLRQVMTGTTTLNKDTLIRMTESRRKNAQKVLDSWNKRVESGEVNDYFKYSKLPKAKVDYTPPTVTTPAAGMPSQSAIEAELARRRKK